MGKYPYRGRTLFSSFGLCVDHNGNEYVSFLLFFMCAYSDPTPNNIFSKLSVFDFSQFSNTTIRVCGRNAQF